MKVLNDIEATIPIIDEEVLNSRGHSTFELGSGSPSFAASEEEHENFVHPSSQLSLQPTTPPPPLLQARPRKMKHFDTKTTIFSNDYMRKMIEAPNKNTHRKRKKLPSPKLGFWRLDNQSKKDQIFNRSLFTGFSDVLSSLFEKDCVASKPYLAVSDETFLKPASVLSLTQKAEK
ncbi:Sister chromatid cohesion 1 protein 3 [Cardamine amara subsp. amara]|uniref:Sister chromatid cohesion 1 protein 3 n=1 Tax=Cardamine amara subsp. amara TaxID=228776 RepID=A0ABD0Z2Z9_CARAN